MRKDFLNHSWVRWRYPFRANFNCSLFSTLFIFTANKLTNLTIIISIRGIVEETRKQSLFFFFFKKKDSLDAKQSGWRGEVWIAIAAGCFQMKRSIRKTGFHGTWWSRGFGSILSKGWWWGEERVSTLLYFQQLVFLDDCVTFRFSRISIYFQPEQRNFRSAVRVNPPSLDATGSSTCFPAISSGYRPFLPLRYLFIDRFAAGSRKPLRCTQGGLAIVAAI